MLYDEKLVGFGDSYETTQQRVTVTRPRGRRMGMIGFDIVCESVRSGSRMQAYLVNDARKKISANSNRTVSAKADFALAA